MIDISFEEAILRELGAAPAHAIPDGKFHSFPIGKHKDHGWYIYHDGKFPAGAFGDWGTGERHKWRLKNGASKLTPADRALIKEQQAKREAEEAKRHALAAKEASALLEKASPANPEHPYLVKKQIKPHGIKQDAGRLIIPVYVGGKIASVQTIAADGFKLFLEGGRTGGGAFQIGDLDHEVIIGEGFATVATLHELFQTPVIAAFSAHNLLAVAKATRAKYPDAKIVFAADDDFGTERDKGFNPGIHHARAAAKAIGGLVAIPPFDRSKGDTGTDWNDYVATNGAEAAEAAFNATSPEITATDAPEAAAEEPCASAQVIDFEIARLAKLREVDYEKVRKDAAKKLNLRKPVLDKLVAGSRPPGASNGPEFRMTTRGLIWGDENTEIVVSGPFEVVAECRDTSGSSWGRLLRWNDSDGRAHEWAMSVSLLAGDGLEVRKALLDGGLYVGAGSKARGLLTNFLAAIHVDARARAVTTTGWHGNAFVFPGGAIGLGTSDEHVILQTPHFIDHAYDMKGSLEDWQTNVAKYAEGNSRLVLAVSMAFAAALAGPCEAESGGIHLRGRSSAGKTTGLHVAGSVWGGGDRGFIRSWRATANGLEGVAAIHSDALLCLDEIAQLGAKEAGEAAYMLAIGQGKSRASRDATLRTPARWRLLFLSSGEIGLADKIAEDLRGRRQTAGQQVRVVDLPADTGAHGIFEDLHGFSDAARLADYLRSASSKFYGTAARVFIESIAKDLDSTASAMKASIAQFIVENCGEGADGQVKRVASRFGLIAAAGELAICLGILPWTPGSALASAIKCFEAWLEARGGIEPAEEKDGIEAVRSFLSAHMFSRFLPAWEHSDFDPKTPNLAGYRKHPAEEPDSWDFFITAPAWGEVAAGFNKTALADALAKKGFLVPGGSSKRAKNLKVPGAGERRVYHIHHSIFGGDGDA